MQKHKAIVSVSLVGIFIFTLLLSSCGGGSESINIGYGSNLDPADMDDALGIKELEKKLDVSVVEMSQDSNVVAGLIKGEIQLASIGCPDTIKAIQMGVPLKIIFPADMVAEFVLIGQPGIKTVEDFVGKKVAYHGPGSGTEILPRMLVNQSGTVTDDQVEWIILPESPNRAAAMQAKRIDVTALEYADVLTLLDSGQVYEIIASFADVAPEAIYSCWVTTEAYAVENPEVLKELGIALAKGYDLANNDKDAWMAIAKEKLPVVDESRLSRTYDFYASVHNFPAPPYFNQEVWDKMNAFYTSVGEYEDPAPFSDLDMTAINAALEAMK